MKKAHHSVSIRSLVIVLLCCSGIVRAEQVEDDAAPAVRVGVVTSNVLNVRARAATHYEVVCQVKRDDEVQIVGQNEKWFEILAPKHTKAYIAKRFIGADDEVSGDRVRIHAGPGIVFTTFGHVNEREVVNCVGEPVGEWQQIESPPHATVWVSRAYIKAEPPPAPEIAVATVKVDEVAVKDEPAEEEPDRAAPVAESVKGGGEAPSPARAASPPHTEAVAELTLPSPKPEDKPERDEKPTKPTPPVEKLEPPKQVKEELVVQQGAEIPLPAPPAEPERSSSPIVKSEPVSRTGVVFALADPVENVATHFLALRIHYTCYPVCYLRSSRLDLTEWELRQVQVEGKQKWYPGWKRAVIDVTGIQINR